MCWLCGGDHTTNYRGCPAQLKLKNNSANQAKSIIVANSSQRVTSKIYEHTQNSNSYAKVLKSHQLKRLHPITQPSKKYLKMCGQFKMMISQNIQTFNLLIQLIIKLIKMNPSGSNFLQVRPYVSLGRMQMAYLAVSPNLLTSWNQRTLTLRWCYKLI